MGVLNIRNLPDEVHRRLRMRAAAKGKSMEAEARDILSAACASPEPAVPGESLQEFVGRVYGDDKPEGVVDDLIADRRREASRE